MNNNFDSWNCKKKLPHSKAKVIGFNQSEMVVMCKGANVGYEQDGKGDELLRPALVGKKYNDSVFVGFPLTAQAKNSKVAYRFERKKAKKSFTPLPQNRKYDIKSAEYNKGGVPRRCFRKMREKGLDLLVTPLQMEGERLKAKCGAMIIQEAAGSQYAKRV